MQSSCLMCKPADLFIVENLCFYFYFYFYIYDFVCVFIFYLPAGRMMPFFGVFHR